MTARLPRELLREMQERLSAEETAEMAIPSYLHRNPALRAMAWWRVRALGRRLERAARERPTRALRIVDLGCGAGVLLERESELGAEVFGVDPVLGAARLLVERRGLGNVTLLGPEQAYESLEPASVDLVVAGEVLEHIEPLAPVAHKLRRMLRPDGLLLASLPTENGLYRLGRRIAGFRGHYHHSDARGIDRELIRAGFRRRWRRSLPAGGPLSIYWIVDYQPIDAS